MAIDPNTIEVECHLIIGARFRVYDVGGGRKSYTVEKRPVVRVSKGKPATAADEIAIALKLQLPIALFHRPELTASIVVPPERTPFVIDAATQERIADVIREQTGLTIRLEVAAPEGGA
jgi:hypothetical protein